MKNEQGYMEMIKDKAFDCVKAQGYMENPPSYKTTPKTFFNRLGVDYVWYINHISNIVGFG